MQITKQVKKAPRQTAEIIIKNMELENTYICLLYTSDAADDLLCVDLGGRRIIKKKKINKRQRESLPRQTIDQ